MRGHLFPTFKYCCTLTMRVTSFQHSRIVWLYLQMAITLGGWLGRRLVEEKVEEVG